MRSHLSLSWKHAPAIAQLDDYQAQLSSLIVSLDRRREEAKLEDSESEEAREELVEQLRYRMKCLEEEGGNVRGLPVDWEKLSSHDIANMLTEVETVYRNLLQERLAGRGEWAAAKSDLSLDRLEQILRRV